MRRISAVVWFVFATLLLGVALSPPPGTAATSGNSHPQPGRIVSDDPSGFTPNILNGTVYSIVQVGDTVVVGGSFTQVQNANSGTTLTRNRVFAFNATTGAISTTFVPNPNGTVYKVQAAADGTSVYVGGNFTTAYGQSIKNLFRADVSTGARISSFSAPNLSGAVRDLEVVGNRLFVAGKFTHIGGVAQKALGSLNATTGARDPYFGLTLAGLHRTGYDYDVTDVLQMSSNPSNTQLTAVGNFTSVNGSPRSQIAKFDISGPTSATLANWSTNQFTGPCSSKFDTYMTDVEYSPNGQFFVVSTTGAYGGLTGSMAGTTGCDGVFRFESSTTGSAIPNTWSAYTGGDTTWTVEVTDNVVYAGGHQRWQNNPTAGDRIGQGAVERTGIAALNTVNGMPYSWNPTRTRGVGIQDMLATSQGLWVGSDTDRIGNYEYHARIALLPLATGKTLPVMSNPGLPTTVYSVSSGGSQLLRKEFDGTTATTPVNAPNGTVSWGSTVGAFVSNGVLYSAASNGQVTKRTFDGTSYGTASPVNASDALAVQTDWHNTDIPTMTSLFFYDGRIYFTRSGQSSLYSRGFETESDVVGQQRPTSGAVSGISYSSIRGAFVANDKFYFANTSGQLFRADWSGRAPVGGTAVQVSGPGIDGINWASRSMFVLGDAAPPPPPPENQPPTAAATISCNLLECSFNGTGSDDTDGTITSYVWDFGDGQAGSGATTTHTYAGAGPRTVKLTVTDDDGAVAEVTRSVNPTDVASPIAFLGANGTVGNRTSHPVTIPNGVEAGDALVLFFSANSTTPTYTGPAGWTAIGSVNGSGVVGRAWSKVATAGDAGGTVLVTSSGFAKSHIAVAAYHGTDPTSPVAAAASGQDSGGAAHTSPTVTAPAGTNWLVTYWADKSSATTAWTVPPEVTVRHTAFGTPSGYMSGLVADSNGSVSGPTGGLTATANSTSSRGLSFSVVLH